MKFLPILLALTLSLFLESARAAQTADTRIYCLSIQFNRANAGGPNAIYSLELTGVNNQINGELYPVFQQPRTHETFLILTDDIFDDEFPGFMRLNVPTTDLDGDGFSDIFDASKSFNGTSAGTYNITGVGSGNVTATWARGADSPAGSCRLNFQNFGVFFHTFNILEYKGPLTYTPASNTVTGSVALSRTGATNNQLNGPFEFTKVPTNRYNQFMRAAGAWTNDVPETLTFSAEDFDRDTVLKTNYYGFLEFTDWDLNTADPDYFLWIVSVDDRHDADADGIPDLSDDPAATARRPILGIKRTQTNLLLTISANVGQVCEIQEASTVNATTWPTISSVTLTNDPQTVSLPLPTSSPKFYRARTP